MVKEPISAIRHFTATGFVVHERHVALHWHRKVHEWLPPGGHIDDNEDPVQAVLREIAEESGLEAEIANTAPVLGLQYPYEVAPPYTIMVEDIDDPVEGYHQHIDMIYICRLVGPAKPLNEGWRWVSEQDLSEGIKLKNDEGTTRVPPRDVRLLAKRAFEVVSIP